MNTALGRHGVPYNCILDQFGASEYIMQTLYLESEGTFKVLERKREREGKKEGERGIPVHIESDMMK